jgi:hypothetical protein
VRLFHDAVGLAVFDSRHERVEFDAEAEAAFIILNQADERADSRPNYQCADFFRGVDQSAVITDRVGGGEQMLGIRPAFSMPGSSELPKVMLSKLSGVLTVPERAP